MKLVDIIKTKNGLCFLGNNLRYLPTYGDKLGKEIPQYDPEIIYGEADFSYKNYARTLQKMYHNRFYNVVYEIYRTAKDFKNGMASHIVNDKRLEFDGDFIDINKDEVSFMPYNKVQKTQPNGEYMKTGRQTITIHKFIAKVFKNKTYTEQQKKEFAEYIISQTMQELTIEFIKGNAIGEHYANVAHTGWARYSCMANATAYPAKRFTIYNENCELGVIKDGDEVVGRFLRWKTVDGRLYEDSLYYKTYSVQSWYQTRVVNEKILYTGAKDNKVIVELVKPFKDYTAEEKPAYLDTLTTVSKDGKQISNDYNAFK